jgi:membrane-associated phospholipid phosphatase
MYLLKSFFHAPRPYFIDFELADKTLNETCSAEFGSPSGHSVGVSGPFTGIVAYYVFIKYKDYYNKNPVKKIFIYILTAIKIFLVTYSRVYTGRHSFDQLISGISLGLFCTHFSTFYFVPNYYNHIMDWNRKHDNWKYFRYSVIFFISFLVSAGIIFLYVDKNVPIPNEWYT